MFIGFLIAGIIWAGLIGYPILQIVAIVKMHGRWRILACLPLVLMLPVLFVTIQGLYQQSNLWPIILIFTGPIVLVYLIVLLIVHKVSSQAKKTEL